MKKFLNLTLGITLFLATAHTGFAQFTVVPAEPFLRQFNIEMQPEENFSGAVIVKNLSNKPLKIKVYGADATHSNQGTFALTTLSKEQRSIGTWVSFLEEEYTIEEREEKSIPFNITLPVDTTPGNYAGGIAIESITEKTGAVSSSSRIYVKMFLNVPGEKNFGFDWHTFHYEPASKDTKALFSLGIKNNGNTIVIAETVIDTFGFPPLKNPQLIFPAVTIQPGIELENIEKRWDELGNFGYYQATAKVTFSELDIVNNTKINSVTYTKTLFINATPIFLNILILLAVLVIVLFPVYKYTRYKIFIKNCEPYTVQEGDTLAIIATNKDIPWKKLIKINHLKPPYTIQNGQNLIVPKKTK